MIFTRGLVIKWVGGLCALATATCAGIYWKDNIDYLINGEDVSLIERVGLDCDGDSRECTLKVGRKINVRRGEINFVVSTLMTGGKIKVYVDDNDGYKFMIEEGDITIGSNKLEEFEEYGIIEENDGYYLSRNREAKEGIRGVLGLPCDLPENDEKVCENITEEQFKSINFEDVKVDGEFSFSGNSKLKITKRTDTNLYPYGYKLVFINDSDVSVPKSKGIMYIKKNTNAEFKVKRVGAKLALERAWTIESLGEKVGLKCVSTNKECSFVGGKINVFYDEIGKVKGASLAEAHKDKKITFEEDQGDHNQGFKFTVGEDIELNEGEVKRKIFKDISYEIKEQDDGEWYLSRRI